MGGDRHISSEQRDDLQKKTPKRKYEVYLMSNVQVHEVWQITPIQ